jgi:hypothetical protein
MPGDPRHPKAKGYTGPSTDPVAKLTEQFGKINAETGQMFSSLTALRNSFRQFERLISRVNFLLMAQAGFHGAVPYGVRDLIGKGHGGRRAGTGHGTSSFGSRTGGGPPGPVFPQTWRGPRDRSPALDPGMTRAFGPRGWTYAPRGTSQAFMSHPGAGGNTPPRKSTGDPGLDALLAAEKANRSGAASALFGPGGKFSGMAGGPGRTANQVVNTANFTIRGRSRLLIGGGKPPDGAFDAFFKGGRPDPYGGLGKDGHGLSKEGAGKFFLASTAIAGGLARAGAPDALETFMKSLELAAAKMGGSFVPPLAAASRQLQTFAAWFDRQPEFLKKGFGWVAAFGVTGTGAVLMVGMLAKAAMTAATACAWLARSAGGAAAAQTGGAAAGAGGSAAVGAAGAGGAAAGAATKTGRAFLGRALGRAAGPLGVAYGIYDVASSDTKGDALAKLLHGIAPINPLGHPFVEAAQQRMGVPTLGETVDGLRGVKRPGKPPNNRVQLASTVEPMFMGVDDIYRQVQLSVLKQPMDQDVTTTQLANLGTLMEQMRDKQDESNKHLAAISGKESDFKK